jgi:hypothetical protein
LVDYITSWYRYQPIVEWDTVLSLTELVLTRLQEYSLFVSVLQSLAVVVVVTTVVALKGLWVVGVWLAEKKTK